VLIVHEWALHFVILSVADGAKCKVFPWDPIAEDLGGHEWNYYPSARIFRGMPVFCPHEFCEVLVFRIVDQFCIFRQGGPTAHVPVTT
jgi:hypothetical protein